MKQKESNTSERLKQIMDERNLKQIDIVRLARPYCEKYNIKLNRSNVSQYVSGSNEPQQDKIFILSLALDVSEGWLMGHDVSRVRQPDADRFARFADAFNAAHPELTQTDVKLHINDYKKLSDDLRRRVDKYTKQLLQIQSAEEDLLLAAHARTDIEATPEDVRKDIDMVKAMKDEE